MAASVREERSQKRRLCRLESTIPKKQLVSCSFAEFDSLANVSNNISGEEYMLKVTGIFCKLCRRFFLKDDAAQKAHCKAQDHYDNLVEAQVNYCNQIN